MRRGKLLLLSMVLGLAGLFGHAGAGEKEPPKKEPEPLVVIDAGGKEQKLTKARFTQGVRRLAWLAEPAKEGKGKEKKTPAGPEALALRAQKQVFFPNGVVTLVPLERVRSLDYDYEAETVKAKVAVGGEEKDITLSGPIGYLPKYDINRVTIEAEKKGKGGVAEFNYQGGGGKGSRGIKGVRFPETKVTPLSAGRPAVVKILDKSYKETHSVSDLLALYRMPDGSERLEPTLMFKKTYKIDMKEIKKIVAGEGSRFDEPRWEVTQGDETTPYTLLSTLPIDGKMARLVGLVGRVPYGYKLFPPARIEEIHFDVKEVPKEKEKEKEKGKEKEKDKDKKKEKVEAVRR